MSAKDHHLPLRLFWLLGIWSIGVTVLATYTEYYELAIICGIFAFALNCIIAYQACPKCGKKLHVYIRTGITAKYMIGFAYGRCMHCGEKYLN